MMATFTDKEREAIERCIERLDEITGGDQCDFMHRDADYALIELIENLGLHHVAAAYEKVVDSAEWWAFA